MKRLWWFLSLLLLTAQGFSQSDDQFFIQHLDNRNGLSNSSVNHLFQDKDNILWIGTWDGLNMFEGSGFHVFNYGVRSIGNNVIRYITQDKSENIWITTIEGVSRYEKRTGSFHNYFYNHSRKSRLSEQEFKLATDANGAVFCWTQPYGLTLYDPKPDSFAVCEFPHKIADINMVSFDENDHLWLLTNDRRLFVYSRQGTGFKRLHVYNNTVTNFFIVNKQVFFSTTQGQLYEVNGRNLRETLALQMPSPIKAITFYKDHYLLAWSSGGIGIYNKSFLPSNFLGQEADRMRDMKITSFTLGSEQILWCGTDGNGLIKIYPKTKSFETIYTSNSDQLSNKSVRAFSAENNNLWVGTKGSGIIKFTDFWNNPHQSAKQYFTYPDHLDNNSVFVIRQGVGGLMYIGTDGKGIGVYDIEHKKLLKWGDIEGHARCCDFGSVYAILQDPDSTVWLGTSGYGLIHLKFYRNREGKIAVAFLEQFTFKDNDKGPANDII